MWESMQQMAGLHMNVKNSLTFKTGKDYSSNQKQQCCLLDRHRNTLPQALHAAMKDATSGCLTPIPMARFPGSYALHYLIRTIVRVPGRVKWETDMVLLTEMTTTRTFSSTRLPS
jgi:hypothetical protein